MRYRKLGSCGLKVSEVALGAWLTYGSSVEGETATRCIHRAIERGVNFIDVADVYAGGRAEEVVGRAVADRDRTRLVISSKVFWPMSNDVNDRGLSRKHIMASVHKSLKRLGTDHLDIYFCHRFDPETPLAETARAMDDLIRQGKVLYWGTSVWTAEQLEEVCALCRAGGYTPPQCEQPRFNLFDRGIESDGVIETAHRLGMGLVVWSPLAQGLLSGKYNEGPPRGSRGAETNWLDRLLNEANVAKVRALTALAAAREMSTAQLALAWCLRRQEIASVITGATRPEHVEDNVAASDHWDELDDEVLSAIEAIFGP